LTEVEQVYPVIFEELRVSQKDLEAVLGAKDPLFSMAKMPATQPVLERYVKWIQEFLASKGCAGEDFRQRDGRRPRVSLPSCSGPRGICPRWRR